MDEVVETKVRKRKQRAILSCNDCRRRKLKCDREFPCNRCINGGIAEKCAYGKDAHLVEIDSRDDHSNKRVRRPSASPQPFPSLSWSAQLPGDTQEHFQLTNGLSEIPAKGRISELEGRIETLEALLSSLQKKVNLSSPPNAPSGLTLLDESSAISAGLFKGQQYSTFYYGFTSAMTVIAHFPDLRPFMKRVYVNSTLARLREDHQKLEDRTRGSKLSNRVLSVPDLRSLLPDRATVDKVVKTYFDTFETTYRILHIPSFWAAYQSYWDAPSETNSDMDATVLAILACTLCISTHESTRYDTNGSTFRSKAILWIKACEAWLRTQSNKHRTLATLQVRCLRLLALSTTCFKTKVFYQEVQAHVGIMRASGLHRDPSILGTRCSVFEGEIRRRLWATSMELEIQASIDKGTPSVLSGLQYDSAPPRNLDDSELYPDMQCLPRPQPACIFTDTSYLQQSLQSVPLRVKLCALANALQPRHSFQETLQDEEEILKALSHLPAWNDPRSLQARTLLDLQLRQFLVIVHTQRALPTQLPTKPDFRYSALTCLEASMALISLHLTLLDARNYALCCIRSDYLRAALLICHIAYYSANAPDTIVARTAKLTFEETMDKAFRLLEERSLRPGRGNHQFWFISAACSLVNIQYEPSRTEVYERQAVDRVCKSIYKILSLQDDPAEETLAQEVILGEGPVPTSVPANPPSFNLSPTFQLSDPALPNAATRVDGFDDATASNWVLDDFWLMDALPATGLNEKFDLRF